MKMIADAPIPKAMAPVGTDSVRGISGSRAVYHQPRHCPGSRQAGTSSRRCHRRLRSRRICRSPLALFWRARLDHAYDLFKRGLAPVVITTGGAGSDPSYSEGGVGRRLPHAPRHPGAPLLIAETLGTDTAHSAERVAVIMRANGMHACLAVSDEYHVFRIKELLRHEGMQVYVAPRSGSRPRGLLQRMIAVLREAMSYFAWKMNIPA